MPRKNIVQIVLSSQPEENSINISVMCTSTASTHFTVLSARDISSLKTYFRNIVKGVMLQKQLLLHQNKIGKIWISWTERHLMVKFRTWRMLFHLSYQSCRPSFIDVCIVLRRSSLHHFCFIMKTFFMPTTAWFRRGGRKAR